VVTGAGWIDVYIRLPAYWIAAGITSVLGLMPLIPAVRHRLSNVVRRYSHRTTHTALPVVAVASVGILASWVLALTVVPGLVQWLVVEPNEITLERPYLEHNIQFTRRGFGLDRVEERQFPVSQSFSREIVDNNQDLISEVRLWDWRALAAVYQQFQEIRGCTMYTRKSMSTATIPVTGIVRSWLQRASSNFSTCQEAVRPS